MAGIVIQDRSFKVHERKEISEASRKIYKFLCSPPTAAETIQATLRILVSTWLN